VYQPTLSSTPFHNDMSTTHPQPNQPDPLHQHTQSEAGGADPETLDPRSDLKLTDLSLNQQLGEWQAALAARGAMPCHACPGTAPQFALVKSEALLRRRVDVLAHELSDASLQQVGRGVLGCAACALAEGLCFPVGGRRHCRDQPPFCSCLQHNVCRTFSQPTRTPKHTPHETQNDAHHYTFSPAQLPEFHQRVAVLRDLGYVDAADDTVTIKGRAACEINSTQVGFFFGWGSGGWGLECMLSGGGGQGVGG